MSVRMKLASGCVVLALAGAGLTGCQSTPVPQSIQYSPNESIYVTTPSLAKLLRFSPTPVVDRTRANMEVSVATQSVSGERLILDYHFVWYDDRGVELAPGMGWREIILEPGQTRQLQSTAPNARATGWKLEVRWANR